MDAIFWHHVKHSSQNYLFIAGTPYFLWENKNKQLLDFKCFYLGDFLLLHSVSYQISLKFVKARCYSRVCVRNMVNSTSVDWFSSHSDTNAIIWKLQEIGGQFTPIKWNMPSNSFLKYNHQILWSFILCCMSWTLSFTNFVN